MALIDREKYSYGDGPDDIRACLTIYSTPHSEPVTRFARAVCSCGCDAFYIDLCDGLAMLECRDCETNWIISDRPMTRDKAERYATATGAQLCQCAPPCNGGEFQAVGGVNTKQVLGRAGATEEAARWFYLGLRCLKCGMVSCWADWRADCPVAAILGDGPDQLLKAPVRPRPRSD